MKFFTAALAVAAVLASASSQRLLTPGNEYVYEGEIAATAGTMDHATHSTGFAYRVRVRIQPAGGNRLNVEWSNLRTSQFNGPHVANDYPFAKTTFLDNEEPYVRSFGINHDDKGLVQSIEVASDEGPEMRNLFKAFAAQIQVNRQEMADGKAAFKSQEKLLEGDCEVTYTVAGDMIIKTVNHDTDCRTRRQRIYRNHGLWECRSGQPKLPTSTTRTVFGKEVQDDGSIRISKVGIAGTFLLQGFEEAGPTFFMFTNATYTLSEVKSSAGDISVSGETVTDLGYEFLNNGDKWNVDRDLKEARPTLPYISDNDKTMSYFRRTLEQLTETMANLKDDDKESISNAHVFGVGKLAPLLTRFNYDELMALADEYLVYGSSDEATSRANVFAETLGSVGSTASALAVLRLVLDNRFDNDRDTARVLTSVPFHVRIPNTQLVKEFEVLLDESFDGRPFTKMAATLVFAHMVRQTCMATVTTGDFQDMRKCNEEFGSIYAKRWWNDYKASNDYEEKQNILAALNVLGVGQQPELLRPLIFGEIDKDEDNLRANALWSAFQELFYDPSNGGPEYVLPLFTDKSNPTRLRTAALEGLMMMNPSNAHLSAVMVTLYTEKNYEVLNYAFTLFERVAQSISPCDVQTAQLAQFYLKFMRQYSNYNTDWGFGVSKTWARQYQKEKYGYGGGYTYFVIGSDRATVPVTVGAFMTTTLSNRYIGAPLGIVVTLEGLSKWAVRKFKTFDISTWKTEELEQVLKGMNIRERPDVPVRVQVTIRVKNIIVINRVYTEKDFSTEGKFADFFGGLQGLGDEYGFNHQRVITLETFMMEQPTANGFPSLLASSLTDLASLKATVKKGVVKGLLYRDITYDMKGFAQGIRLATIINPFRKIMFGVSQDRIYSLTAKRNLVAGVNLVKKEVKLTVSRPPHDEPWRFLMHSHTRTFLIGDETNQLQNYCPTCENAYVVSRGEDAVQDRIVVDKEDQKAGGYLNAKYFDCEIDISRKNVVGTLMTGFGPYNKSPKDGLTSLIMGLRQVRAFFFYFPKVEQCGLSIKASQSKNNPVSATEITIRGNMKANGEEKFYDGRKWYLRGLIRSIGEPADRTVRVNFMYEFTPNKVYNNMVLQVMRDPVEAIGVEPYAMCLSYESRFPAMGKSMFEFSPEAVLENTGKARVRYGKVADCDETDGEIRVTFKHSTTDYATTELLETPKYKQCMEQKETDAWKNKPGLPMTEACMYVVWDAANARKYTWNVQFVKVTDRMRGIISKFRSAMNLGLLPYWNVDPESVEADGDASPFINIEAEFKNFQKNADITVETSQGKQSYESVPLSLNWGSRLRQLKMDMSMAKLYYKRLINTCLVSLGDIKTLDNVTIPYQPSGCWTLTSASCSPMPTYAVFTKKVGDKIAARIYLGGHIVELGPNGAVTVNGDELQLQDNEKYEHVHLGSKLFGVMRWGTEYYVDVSMSFFMVYNDYFVNIIPSPSTKGQHCGICGNFNRNPFDEFTGRDGEIVDGGVQDFVRDWQQDCA